MYKKPIYYSGISLMLQTLTETTTIYKGKERNNTYQSYLGIGGINNWNTGG